MSRANKSATRITLASDHLDGYSGPVDIVTYHRRSWWRRLLRRRTVTVSRRVYADVRRDGARTWRRDV